MSFWAPELMPALATTWKYPVPRDCLGDVSDKVADANEERLNGTSERPGRRGDVRATTSLLRAIAQPGSAILCQDVAPLLRRTSAACRRARHGPLLGNVYSHTHKPVLVRLSGRASEVLGV